MADELKAKGNAAFSEKRYEDAIKLFADAIAITPENYVLWSNKSAAEASLGDYGAALESAKRCVALKPDWAKGYSRLGAAEFGLGDYTQAIQAYEDGLKLDPSNELLRSGLQEAKEAAAAPSGGTGPFASPEVLTRLALDPRTRGLLANPGFRAMLSDVQSNPQAMGKYLENPNFQLLLEVALGVKMSAGGPGGEGVPGDMEVEHEASSAPPPPPASKPEPVQAPKPAPAAQPAAPAPEVDMPDAQQGTSSEDAARHQQAIKAKEAGNDAYKAKRFDEAISHYNRALELYDKDISFLTNRAAVWFETGQYDKCMEDCDTAVERGRELRADYKLLAKAMTRKGSALVKLNRLEDAVVQFNKSLTEHRNADTLKKLNDAEKTLKDQREQAYINLDKCNEEKDKGNTAFKEQRYPEAVAAYQEALKRGPPSVNPDAFKLYSNLAACYTKLGAYPEGIKAADKCIELAPKFAKGYSRKGALQFFCKDYEKALDTYRVGLEHEPDNEELMEGVQRCVAAISRIATGQASEQEIKERQARSLDDPDIQNILRDPIMQQVLRDFQEDPKSAQKHLQAPAIMAKLNKLVAAGIIQLK